MSYITPAYRADIDGLRALAVIPVVLFHADFELFSGGFVGVDVFFVISGYLITGILVREMNAERFSLAGFYERRIRRIFPALFATLALSTFVAIWLMLPGELYLFAQSVISATFFASNYYFMFDAGYFTVPAETRPLLHAWSLAIEEQFYIVFPFLLSFLLRYGRWRTVYVLTVIVLLSFGYCMLVTGLDSRQAFFSTPARVWELLIGSLLALVVPGWRPGRSLANIFGVTGLILLGLPVFLYTPMTPFPGWGALPPVLGTALLIMAGTDSASVSARVLGVHPLRFIGYISYSLYLLHWPALVFFEMWNIQHASAFERGVVVFLVFIGAALMWRFIETPFRKRSSSLSRRALFRRTLTVMVAASGIGSLIVMSDGLEGRSGKRIQTLQHVQEIMSAANDRVDLMACNRYSLKAYPEVSACHFGAQTAQVSFVLLGDSHGESLLPAVEKAAKAEGKRGIYIGKNGCPMLVGVDRKRRGCDKPVVEAALSYIDEHPRVEKVIMASRWARWSSGKPFRGEAGDLIFIRDQETHEMSLEENRRVFRRGLTRTVAEISERGLEPVIVMPVPETQYDIPNAYARTLEQGRDIQLGPTLDEYFQRIAFVREVVDGIRKEYPVTQIWPHERICGQYQCRVLSDGVPIYRDSNHITRSFAPELAKLFQPIFAVQTGDSREAAAGLGRARPGAP